jgi:quinol monooxygenase YgiN
MSISLIVSGVGAAAAAVGIGLLLARCLRAPRGDLIAWSVALVGLLISLAAQALGHLMGFNQVGFRAMEIGAQLIAPLALLLGLAELAGTTPIARFLARVYVPALGLIGLVVLGSDPLSSNAFTKAWPAPAVYYQLIPNKLMQWGLAPACLIVAVVLLGLALYRSRRSQQWHAVALPVAAAAVAVLVLVVPILAPAISDHLGVTLPLSGLFPLLCLVAVALTSYAGITLDRTPVAALRDSVSPREHAYDGEDQALDHDGWGRGGAQWDAAARSGDFEPYDDGGQGVYRDGGLYRDEPPGARQMPVGVLEDETGYGWQGRPAYPAQDGTGDFDSREIEAAYGPNGYKTAGRDAGRYNDVAGADRDRLFGQIAIYTLIEERTREFDVLTGRVVTQVRTSEPDTLVYIVHAVPSAPMQRILYEVYRDHAAYEQHCLQPYVVQFELDRRPYVLATNVIELGLQQAKVSPFPSIADLFGEPGYDTSGFERPDYTRDYGSSAGRHGAP